MPAPDRSGSVAEAGPGLAVGVAEFTGHVLANGDGTSSRRAAHMNSGSAFARGMRYRPGDRYRWP